MLVRMPTKSAKRSMRCSRAKRTMAEQMPRSLRHCRRSHPFRQQQISKTRSMGKHETGFTRVERDDYPTPPWPVVDGLAAHVSLHGKKTWEFACGRGDMVRSLETVGANVYATGIVRGYPDQHEVLDFLAERTPSGLAHCDLMATNPPYGPRGRTAEKMIARCLQLLTDGFTNFVALLLSADFDSGSTRSQFFRSPFFDSKIILTRRIVWFPNPDPDRERPKENNAWFCWTRHCARRPPVILYAPTNHKGNQHGR